MSEPTLARNEILNFRLLKRSSILLLLMLRINRPLGSVEASALLEMHRTTAADYFTSLVKMGLAERVSWRDGFVLSARGRKLLNGEIVDLAALVPLVSEIQETEENSAPPKRVSLFEKIFFIYGWMKR